jgi:leucyl-tRNA synthetase
MESSWYYARFACQDQDNAIFDERVQYWLPVDHYIGGIEHAILHLLYARFIHKALRDVIPPLKGGGGDVCLPGNEPFPNLLTQGMVLKNGAKMSKSLGNTVDPQALIEKYGADTLRLFLMFASPPEQTLEWSDSGVEGAFRFLKRVFQACMQHVQINPEVKGEHDEAYKNLRRMCHETIRKVTDDMGRRFIFNTAIAAMMELLNAFSRFEVKTKEDHALSSEILESIVLMLSPITPHLCHALWKTLGHSDAIIDASWPKYDESALVRESIEMVIQVNGKVRGNILVPAHFDKKEIEEHAIAHENVKKYVTGKEIKKVIVVPQKLINIVVSE